MNPISALPFTLVAAFWTLATPDGSAAQQDTARLTAIVNVNVLPMNVERVLAGQTVLIENGPSPAWGVLSAWRYRQERG